MRKIIIILVFLVCGISSAQQYFFNGTVYVPKTTVQINAIVSPPEGRTEANSDTGSLWYFDGTIWKDTFVGVSSFEDLEGDPYDNVPLSDALNSKAADSTVVKTSVDSQIQNLKLAVGDSAWIASKTFGANDIVINTDENPPGGDNYVTGGGVSGAGVLTLTMNYGSPIQIHGFNSGGGNYLPLSGGTMSGSINMSGFNIMQVDTIFPARQEANPEFSKTLVLASYVRANGPLTANGLTTRDGEINFQGSPSLNTASISGTRRLVVTSDNKFALSKHQSSAEMIFDYDALTADRTYIFPNESGTVLLDSDLSATSGTSTAIPLNNNLGYYGNMTTPSSSTTFTISGSPVLGSWAKIRINAASQPTVTGATLITGDTFQSNVDMYMILEYNGVITEYYFKKIGL